jgi:peptidoglycan/LPS O-acetylase OafA/YrhL
MVTYCLINAGLFFNLEAGAIQERYSGWASVFYKDPVGLMKVLTFSFYDVFFRFNHYTGLNPPLWTMSVELFGSFIIYAYLLIFRSGERVYWVVAVLLAVAFAVSQSYFLCFIAGYLIAELVRKYPPGSKVNWVTAMERFSFSVFMTLLVVSYYLKGPKSVNTGSFIAIGFVLFASYSGPVKGFLTNRLSTLLGSVSFPLYLIHIAVLCSLSSFLFIWFYKVGLGNLTSIYLNMTITFLSCIAFSAALIPAEKKAIVYSKRIAKFIVGRAEKTRTVYSRFKLHQ